MPTPKTDIVDSVVSLSKRRGFVYPSGEIYGGTRSAWDYGPLGVELKDNVRRQWWRAMVTTRDDIVGLDSAVILPTKVWEASGHLAEFVDPLTECRSCHKRYREDHLREDFARRKNRDADEVKLDEITCPNCGNDRNFQVKTLQMHVVSVDGGRVEVTEESRPAVLEVLCDECESALNFEEFEDTLRKEVLLTIGAR